MPKPEDTYQKMIDLQQDLYAYSRLAASKVWRVIVQARWRLSSRRSRQGR